MIAERQKAKLHPCSDCHELLRHDEKLGWVHVGFVDALATLATWVLCPSRGEPQPRVAK